MKVYNTKLDKYGYPKDLYNFLCETRLMSSGTKGEARFIMWVWNFIAKIVNYLKRVRRKRYELV